MLPVTGYQVVGGRFHRALRDAVVRFVGLDYIQEPPGFNHGSSLFHTATSLEYAVFRPTKLASQ